MGKVRGREGSPRPYCVRWASPSARNRANALEKRSRRGPGKRLDGGMRARCAKTFFFPRLVHIGRHVAGKFYSSWCTRLLIAM